MSEHVFSQMDANLLWVLISAAFVFLMQAGFLILEAGFVRKKNAKSVAMKNLIDWVSASLFFFFIGFGFMFGESVNGIVGSSFFLLDGFAAYDDGAHLGYGFFLFQLAFAGTAVTIVSGAMSERTGFITYLFASIIIAAVIYPVFGHWVWGGGFVANNTPWLAKLGYIDFAGSSVVHLLGATIAFVGTIMVGPRLGRFDAEGNVVVLQGYSLPLSAFGVIILWFGWWGFNGGSTLAINKDVPGIILNTNIAGAAAGLVAFVHAYFIHKKRFLNEKFLGGLLAGLVAITASANIVDSGSALIIGAVAGWVHNVGFEWLLDKKIDDPVGAIPVHGFAGIWGVLALAIFARSDALSPLGMEYGRVYQFSIQLLGVFVCIAWAASVSFVMFLVLRKFVGLRVSVQEEQNGLDISGDVQKEEAPLDIDVEALKKMLES